MLKGGEVCEVCDPPVEGAEGDTDVFNHPRVWRDWATEEWRTNYPPPPGFTGFEQDDWEGETYCRALSDEELAALIAAGIAEQSEAETAISLEDDEAERDAFFAALATGSISRHAGLDPASAFLSVSPKKADPWPERHCPPDSAPSSPG